jgi:hypothetical protein
MKSKLLFIAGIVSALVSLNAFAGLEQTQSRNFKV